MGNGGLREPYPLLDISGAEAGVFSERGSATLLEALEDAATSGIDNGIQAFGEGLLRVRHGVGIAALLTIVNVGDCGCSFLMVDVDGKAWRSSSRRLASGVSLSTIKNPADILDYFLTMGLYPSLMRRARLCSAALLSTEGPNRTRGRDSSGGCGATEAGERLFFRSSTTHAASCSLV